MTNNIQVETQRDRLVSTTPALRIDMSNVEVEAEIPAKKKSSREIEIPERKSSTKRDHVSEISDDGGDHTNTFALFANPKKILAKEIPEIEPIDNSSQESGPPRNYDSDSEKSMKSTRSRRSNGSKGTKASVRSRKSKRGEDESSEYKRSYGTSVFDNLRPVDPEPIPSSTTGQGPGISSFLGSNVFTATRKSDAALTPDEERREKSNYLQQYETKNKDGMYSPRHLSMENSLNEIKDELEFITQKRQMENSLTTWKRGLVLFADSAVALNSTYDPFKVDLTDWSKEIHWDVFRTGKYDEVLDELIIKWRGKLPMQPEWKLLFMMSSSLVFGVMAKKREQAAMAKRAEETKMMEEQVRQQVRAEIANMQQNMQYAPQQQQQYAPQHPMQHQQYEDTRVRKMNDTAPPAMTGPSLSDSDIIKMMESRFVDSTIAGDDSSITSMSTNASKTVKQVTKKVVIDKGIDNDNTSENSRKEQIITVPSSSITEKRKTTKTTTTGKPRGRPKKNQAAEPSVNLNLDI